jgi:hypothetical protein
MADKKFVFENGVMRPMTAEEKAEAKARVNSPEHKMFLATEYQRQRAAEYPSIGDQLDALFHAGVFPAEMAAKIQAVKDAYPKPE